VKVNQEIKRRFDWKKKFTRTANLVEAKTRERKVKIIFGLPSAIIALRQTVIYF
jgi:hypothetical protein